MIINQYFWFFLLKYFLNSILTIPPIPYAGKNLNILNTTEFVYIDFKYFILYWYDNSGRLYRSNPNKCIGVATNCTITGEVNWAIFNDVD